jgi:hypothetical protein
VPALSIQATRKSPNNLANALSRLGRYDEALASFDAAPELGYG